jgi:hypothetical protein
MPPTLGFLVFPSLPSSFFSQFPPFSLLLQANYQLTHYQLRSALALVRFWTLAWLAYIFLEQERTRLQELWQRPVTIGEARREFVRRQRRQLLIWLGQQFQQGVHLDSLFDLLAA